MAARFKIQIYTEQDGWVDVMVLPDPESRNLKLHIFDSQAQAEYAWELYRRGFRYDKNDAPSLWYIYPIKLENEHRIVEVDVPDNVRWP